MESRLNLRGRVALASHTRMVERVVMALASLVLGAAQQAGHDQPEVHVPIPLTTCTAVGGCTTEKAAVTIDAQWRWLHEVQSTHNCLQNIQGVESWDKTIVRDIPLVGAVDCALEGVKVMDYQEKYGVSQTPNGLSLKYVNGQSVGSRLFMMESVDSYKTFKLLNSEFTFDVDVSQLECGLNGAVYFVEMQPDGGRGIGANAAGAKYGTGYCDAQCPHDLKFIDGKANLRDWHVRGSGGRYGSCCSELDIWEANNRATAFTAHPCTTEGPVRCTTNLTCGWTQPDCKCCDKLLDCPCCQRFDGFCDKDGCDFNSFRLGDKAFFGKGSSFKVDTSRPFTVVTQFMTSDDTDFGELTEIKQLYIQDAKLIKHSIATDLGPDSKHNSITDDMCTAQKHKFDDFNSFSDKGGLRAMGEALRRGMVLVMSLWDDGLTDMGWLDSTMPRDKPIDKPGVLRGPCPASAGNPDQLRTVYPDATVRYSNVMFGEIGTTFRIADLMKASPAPVESEQLIRSPQPVAAAPVQPQVEQKQQANFEQVLQTAGNLAVCDESARVPSSCGMCGPNWGDKNKCKRLCSSTPGCKFITSFSDNGCRLYSACTSTWNQDHCPWNQNHCPNTTIYKKLSASLPSVASPAATLSPANFRHVFQSAGNDVVCDESARLAASCGSCGPNWGDQAECQQLCTTTVGCNFFTFFSDRGCRLYSVCTSTWHQSYGVHTSIFGNVSILDSTAPRPRSAISLSDAVGGGCCTASRFANDPCGSCWAGSTITSGRCAESQSHCEGHCSGVGWCPNGITSVVQEHLQGPLLQVGHSSLQVANIAGSTACVPLLIAFALAFVLSVRRLGSRRNVTSHGRPVQHYGQLDEA